MMKNGYDRPINHVWGWMTAVAALAMIAAVLPARGAEESPLASPNKAKKPLKVVILAGQSNMQEPCKWTTLKGLADSPETKPLYDKLVDENGKVRVFKDVYQTAYESKRISRFKSEPIPPYGSPLPNHFGGLTLGAKSEDGKKSDKKGDEIGGKFGPELGFGVTLYEELQEPILIIKAAWGGKSLYRDFRPPTGKEWEPPKDHPDHPDNAPAPLPVPTSFNVPKDFEGPTKRGKNIQIAQGHDIGEMNGIFPIYINLSYGNAQGMVSNPVEEGDMILGVNGEGMPENPITKWRDVFFNVTPKGNGKMTVTVWRHSTGKIETIEVDTTKREPKHGKKDGDATDAGKDGDVATEAGKDGGDGDPAEAEDEAKELSKAERQKLLAEGGEYYKMMLARIKEVLADPGKFHPAYDPKQGYEIAGFVWFQGYNDIIAGVTYPHGSKPRGYEQYSWLLAQLIRSVRQELNAPKMPVVIGVFGQGGDSANATHFREAQAAVADYDEFKGTAKAVQTVGFVDSRISEIANRLDKVMAYKGDDPNHPYAKLQAEIRAYKEKMGDPEKLDKKAKKALEVEINKGVINIVQTLEEREYLENNVSNEGYHYNGSPKFFVRAGQAFAKALGAMMKN